MERAQPLEGRGIRIPVGDTTLEAELKLVSPARGLVVFAHGSGTSRLSPRNRRVATAINEQGLATLLADLLTSKEETVDRISRQFRFDVGLQAGRLVALVDWAQRQPELAELAVGCFGASIGGAAALVAAAQRPQRVRAVVCRSGRVDLAGRWLPSVRAPTILIVGAKDVEVVAINQQALHELHVEKRLEVLAGVTHLFEEPGALEEVARMAGSWFTTFLG